MKHPIVGTTATVVIRHYSPILPGLFKGEPRKTLTYSGEVLPSADYDDKDTFRLVGDEKVPVRVISLKNVVSINGESFKFKETVQPKPIVVTVIGSKGTEYVVTIFPNGKTTCTCPGYGYRGKCSHIEKAIQQTTNKNKIKDSKRDNTNILHRRHPLGT